MGLKKTLPKLKLWVIYNSHLFKSKGTRKSIEMLLRLIGAPDSLVEINEFVYLADQRINVNQFDLQFAKISGGTLVTDLPILEDGNKTLDETSQISDEIRKIFSARKKRSFASMQFKVL